MSCTSHKFYQLEYSEKRKQINLQTHEQFSRIIFLKFSVTNISMICFSIGKGRQFFEIIKKNGRQFFEIIKKILTIHN